MKKLPITILVLVGLFLGPSKVFGQETVADVLASCLKKDAEPESLVHMSRNFFCTGYLVGLFDAFVLTSELINRGIPAEKVRLCVPPAGVENGKIVAIALESMREQTDLKLPARTAAYGAWKKAFPCK